MSASKQPDRWFYKAGGAKHGPVSADGIRAMLQKGDLTGETPVWRDGMESWHPAAEFRDLFGEGVAAATGSVGKSNEAIRRRLSRVLLSLGAIGVAMSARWGLSSRDDDPYVYRPVSGSVMYEDGQLIPSDSLTLTFIPLIAPHSLRVHPRPGFAVVDTKTGVFKYATSRKPGDGLVRGGHKVLVTGANRIPLPGDIVPPEYTDFNTTPLAVDTKSGQLSLKVKRPLLRQKGTANE